MERLIAAYTSTHFGNYPAFINIYERAHDGVVINIRGARKEDGTQGDCATIELDGCALLDLIPPLVKHLGWLPSWVAEYNAAEKRKAEMEALRRQIHDAQNKLIEAERKHDRIERNLESWYQEP